MKFFNIHYECNDAKDYYSKLLSSRMQLMVSFLTSSDLMKIITLIVITLMMVVTLEHIYFGIQKHPDYVLVREGWKDSKNVV